MSRILRSRNLVCWCNQHACKSAAPPLVVLYPWRPSGVQGLSRFRHEVQVAAAYSLSASATRQADTPPFATDCSRSLLAGWLAVCVRTSSAPAVGAQRAAAHAPAWPCYIAMHSCCSTAHASTTPQDRQAKPLHPPGHRAPARQAHPAKNSRTRGARFPVRRCRL